LSFVSQSARLHDIADVYDREY